jgi:hypothetical protein
VKEDINAAADLTPLRLVQVASIWLPEDRALCVATEVDMMWTYVGGAEACINEILTSDRLEAWQATTDDRVVIDGDLVNL